MKKENFSKIKSQESLKSEMEKQRIFVSLFFFLKEFSGIGILFYLFPLKHFFERLFSCMSYLKRVSEIQMAEAC